MPDGLNRRFNPACAAAMLLAVMGMGCATSSDYPANWAERAVADQDCPDIDGAYYSSAIATTSSEPRVSLLKYIHRNRWYTLLNDLSFADGCVELAMSDNDTLTVRYAESSEEALLAELSLDNGDYTCDDGVLWITTDWIPNINALYGAGAYGQRLGLSKTIGGSLVGESHEAYRGVVMLVVPVASKHRDFHRWGACD